MSRFQALQMCYQTSPNSCNVSVTVLTLLDDLPDIKEENNIKKKRTIDRCNWKRKWSSLSPHPLSSLICFVTIHICFVVSPKERNRYRTVTGLWNEAESVTNMLQWKHKFKALQKPLQDFNIWICNTIVPFVTFLTY